MEVGKINKISNSITPTAKNARTVAFKGSPASTATTTIADEAKRLLPKSLDVMSKLKWLKGELGGILVTAVGTGLVAPIFIAFNPLSKTDSDTKKYTALRQPVSAVLAIMLQAGMAVPLANMLEKAANEGQLGDNVLINKVALQSEKYLTMKVKKELKADGSLEGLSKEKATKLIADTVEQRRQKQLTDLVNSLKNEGKITIGSKAIPPQKLAEIVNDTLVDYTNNLHKELKELKKKDVGFKVTRAQVLVNNAEELKKNLGQMLTWSNNTDYQKRIQVWENKARKAGNPELAKIYEELKQKETFELAHSRAENTIKNAIPKFELKVAQAKLLKEKPEVLRDIFKQISNTKDGDLVGLLKQKLTGVVTDEHLLNDFLSDMAEYKDTTTQRIYARNMMRKIEKLKNIDTTDGIIELHQRNYYEIKTKYMRYKLKTLKKTLGSVTADMTPEKAKEALDALSKKFEAFCNKDVYKDIVKMYEKLRDNAFDINKQIKTAFVATIVFLPLTCTALNWVYPRFMDLCFPGLSKSKNGNGHENPNKLNIKERD